MLVTRAPSSKHLFPHSALTTSQSPTTHPVTSSDALHQTCAFPSHTPALFSADTTPTTPKIAGQSLISILPTPFPHSAVLVALAATCVLVLHLIVASLATRTLEALTLVLAPTCALLWRLNLAAHVDSLWLSVGSHVQAHLWKITALTKRCSLTTGFCMKSRLLVTTASVHTYALLLVLILTTHVSATLALYDVRSLISNPSLVYANQPSLRATTVIYVFRL